MTLRSSISKFQSARLTIRLKDREIAVLTWIPNDIPHHPLFACWILAKYSPSTNSTYTCSNELNLKSRLLVWPGSSNIFSKWIKRRRDTELLYHELVTDTPKVEGVSFPQCCHTGRVERRRPSRFVNIPSPSCLSFSKSFSTPQR